VTVVDITAMEKLQAAIDASPRADAAARAAELRGQADELDHDAMAAVSRVGMVQVQAAQKRAEAFLNEAIAAAADAADQARTAVSDAEGRVAECLEPERDTTARSTAGRQHLQKCQRAERQGRRDRLPADELADLRRRVTAAAEVAGELDAEAAAAAAARSAADEALERAQVDLLQASDRLAELERQLAGDPLTADVPVADKIRAWWYSFAWFAEQHGLAMGAVANGDPPGVIGRVASELERQIIFERCDWTMMVAGFKGYRELQHRIDELVNARDRGAVYEVSAQSLARALSNGG
jgi:hypothetical protein